MEPKVIKATSLKEYLTPERCFIYENCGISTGDTQVSIARARIEPNITTKAHHLDGIQEIYLITEGTGRVYAGDLAPAEVGKGDVVIIPAGVSQKITNIGKTDLIFYCICTPAFKQEHYHDEEAEKAH
jgi:mannose-6-phosphate isomerase-like protein (cupin superfamily)